MPQRGSPSGHRADDDHQPACRAAVLQGPVQHPSRDRGADRATARDGVSGASARTERRQLPALSFCPLSGVLHAAIIRAPTRPVPQSQPLAETLASASNIVARVIAGRSLGAALADEDAPTGRRHPAVTDAVYGTLRDYGAPDAIIAALSRKAAPGPAGPRVAALRPPRTAARTARPHTSSSIRRWRRADASGTAGHAASSTQRCAPTCANARRSSAQRRATTSADSAIRSGGSIACAQRIPTAGKRCSPRATCVRR